jgi:hypothetical protein
MLENYEDLKDAHYKWAQGIKVLMSLINSIVISKG